MSDTPGALKAKSLKDAGFSDDEISSWEQRTRGSLDSAGFSPLEVDNYFGVQEPEMSGWGKFFSTELQAVRAGYERSVGGLAIRKKVPETAVPEGTLPRLTASTSQVVADLPVMIAGALGGGAVGGAAGSEVPVVGNVVGAVVGAGAGSMALPEYLRSNMMNAYEKGTVKSAADYVNRAKTVATATIKAAEVGTAFGAAGKIVGPLIEGAGPVVKAAATTGAEVAAGTTMQAATEGRLPEPEEFLDAAVLIFGLKGATAGAARLRRIYAKTGVSPTQVWNDSESDPGLKHELASRDVDVPTRYEPAKPMEVLQPKPTATEGKPPAPEPTQKSLPIEFKGEEGKAIPQAADAPPTAIEVKPPRDLPPVKRPADIVQFLARRGGLKAEQNYYKGDLAAMDAHKLFVPGAGMLVRKNGGLNLDHAREVATEAGYGPFETIPDLLNAMDNAMRGGEEFSSHDVETAGVWREQQTGRRMAPEPTPEENAADQLKDLANRADALGIPRAEDWTAEDLMAAVIEREAIQAEGTGEAEHLAKLERDMDIYLGLNYPHLAQGLHADGYESEVSIGAERGTPPGIEEGGGQHEPRPGGPAGDVAALSRAGGGAEFTQEAGGQLAIPGGERSATQLAAARDAQGHGRTGTAVEQKPADQGLFAEKPRQEPTLFQRGAVFFSALERGVDGLKLERAPADQWRNTIKNLPSVKKEEVDWLGLDDWLKEQKGAVSKADVLDFVRANKIEVQEVEKSGEGKRAGEPLIRALAEDLASRDGKMWDELGNSGRQDYWDRAAKQLDKGGTKFATYQLPGGENYRELLLTLPRKNDARLKAITDRLEEIAAKPTKEHQSNPALTDEYDALMRERKELGGGGWHEPTQFRSGHFDEPNVLAHVRFNDRVDANGKKTLFIEELQSDWHQKGRREGYTEQKTHPPGWASTAEPRGTGRGVPDAPFKTTWPELGFKRMLRYAAENGYDQVAWTTGEQQAARYDLSRHIKAIHYERTGEGKYEVEAFDPNDRRIVHEDEIPIARVEELFGKEIAEKIEKDVGEKSGGPYRDWKIMQGLDLKVGGAGMRGFYDKILPVFLNKYAKKWGAKVGETEIATVADEVKLLEAERGNLTTKDTRETVHALPITDAMRESVMAGQPMFQRTPEQLAAMTPGERVKLTDDLIATLPEKPSAEEQAIIDEVSAIADKIVPDAVVRAARTLKATGGFRQRLASSAITGATYTNGARRVIAWSLESNDPVGTVRHEAVHWLLSEGYLYESEWKALETAAKKGDWIGKHNIEARYPGESPEQRLEESIAEEFAAWKRGAALPKVLRPVFEKISQILQQIGDFVRRQFGADATAYDVFSRIASGEAGAEKIAEPSGTQTMGQAQRSPAEQTVLDRISESPERKGRPFSLNRAYVDGVDDLYAVRVMEKVLGGEAPLPTEESPYKLMRLFRGTAGRVMQFLEVSPFKFATLENTGKSLKEILKPIRGDLDGFRAYMVSRRAIELSGRDIETGIPRDAAEKVVADGDAKYAEIAQELHDYQRSLLDYLKDSGVLSPDGYNKIVAANEDYVPFYRLFSEDEARGGAPGTARGKVRNPVKQIKGSKRLIIDPLESIIKNTELYVKLAEKNRALTALVKLAGQHELGEEYLKLAPSRLGPIEVTDEEINRFLKENDIQGEASDFTIFRPRPFQPAADEIAVFDKGKRKVYKVIPELADAVDKMDPEILPWYIRTLSIAARALRAGATLIPDFIARNLIRDQMTASAVSRYRSIPLYDALQGLGSILRKDSNYQSWLKGGGANGAMVSLDRRYMEQEIFGLTRQTGFLTQALNVIKSPIEMLRVTSEIVENATRVGGFKRAMAGNPNAFAAAFESREITLDFARIGAKMRAMNAITAFANAGIQGIDRTVRAFKDNPLGTTAKVVAAITVPSVLLWYANKDDPRWKGIPDWERDLYWLVMTKDHIYRIPKPFELGIIFGSLPERALDTYLAGDAHAFDHWSDAFVAGLTPNYIPTFALPVMEAWANRSTFTGNKIVPSSMEPILPEFQYTDYTTETAKLIGHYIAKVPAMNKSQFASPILLENYIRAWSGGMGMYVLQAADFALRKSGIVEKVPGPEATLADVPFVKAFVVRYPSASDQRIENFYTRYEKVTQAVATIRSLANRGEPEAALKEMQVEQEGNNLLRLEQVRTGLANMTKAIHFIDKNPNMPPTDKRQMIDGIYLSMISGADMANKMIDQLDEIMKQKPVGVPRRTPNRAPTTLPQVSKAALPHIGQ